MASLEDHRDYRAGDALPDSPTVGKEGNDGSFKMDHEHEELTDMPRDPYVKSGWF